LRLFSEKELFKVIETAGFELRLQRHKDFFDDEISKYYGVNREEDLILAVKPS